MDRKTKRKTPHFNSKRAEYLTAYFRKVDDVGVGIKMPFRTDENSIDDVIMEKRKRYEANY